MELKDALPEALARLKEPVSGIQRQTQNALRNLQKPSERTTQDGVDAFDLIPSDPLAVSDVTTAFAVLETNYGTEYSKEKAILLFQTLLNAGWTKEQFRMSLIWFLKNKQYPAWTVADWFNFNVRIYPYEWFMKQCREGTDVRRDMDIYDLPDGTRGYRWKDGQELPFPKADLTKYAKIKTLEIHSERVK